MIALLLASEQRLVKDVTFCLSVRYPDIEVCVVDSGLKAVDAVVDQVFDLIFIDALLDGIEVPNTISRIRANSDAPIIILSESETDLDRAKGLEAGADEYMRKLFSPIELLARCSAILRRVKQINSTHEISISADWLTFNHSNREVFFEGRRIALTPIEYALLAELEKNDGRPVTFSALLDKVWGNDYEDAHHLIKSVVYRLRLKLAGNGVTKQKIVNEKGVGYLLERAK